jgi:hypothetical protein
MRTRSFVLLSAVASLSFALGCEPTLVCAADTALEDGRCVSQRPDTTCGDGSTFDEVTGECRAAASCGAGTLWDPDSGSCLTAQPCGLGTHLDEESRSCQPDATCGDGTVYDPGSRACLPAAQCGDGTSLDEASGECVPDNRCGEGTLWHPTRRVCVPALTCGPGLVSNDGVCMTPIDIVAAGADDSESVPDDNDPAWGGAPEAVTLEPIGDSLVLTGVIGRPVDRDGDDALDQDVDQWAFDAPAGALLRIRVLDDGVGQPAFRLTGPDEYVRESRRGVVREPSREVLLPRAGEYVLEVAPAGWFGGSAPVGSPEHGYVIVIEELAWPTGLDASPPLLPQASRAALELFDITDNFVNIDMSSGPLMLSATAPDVGTEPVLLVFAGDGAFIDEVSFAEDDGVWSALHAVWVPASGARVIGDWRVSSGFPATLDMAMSQLEDSEIGAVPADAEVEAAPVVLPGLYGAALSFDAAPGQIVTAHLPGLSRPQVTVVGPAGVVTSVSSLDRKALSFVPVQAGRHRLLLVNRHTSDARVLPAIVSTSPRFSGPLAPVDGRVELFGPRLASERRLPDRVWALVDVPPAHLLRADASFTLGMPDFAIFRVDDGGALVERRRAGEDDRAVRRAIWEEGGRALVLLDPVPLHPHNPAVVDWKVGLQVSAAPALEEIAPGTDQASAGLLPALPVDVLGLIADDEHDTYRLELDSALGPDEVLEIDLENVDNTKAIELTITDTTGAELASVRRGEQSSWRIFAGDGAPPFLIDVEGTSDAHRYVLAARRVSTPCEAEPNGTTGQANPLLTTTLPVTVQGRTTKDEFDVFSIGAPGPGVEALLVRVENLHRTGDFDVTLRAPSGIEIMTMDHEDGALLVSADQLPAFVEVVGESSTYEEHYTLSLHAWQLDEVEPNDAPSSATPLVLGDGPLEVWGQSTRSAADVYRVDLSEPLADGESVSVRWFNSLERGDILVRILDESGTDVVAHEDYADESVWAPSGQTLYVSVMPLGYGSESRPELYRLVIERVARRAEVEPNDASATAQALPARFALTGLSRSDDPDLYAIDASGLADGDVLRARSKHELFEVTVALLSETGERLVEATAPSLEYTLGDVPLPASGTLLVEVTADVTGAGELGVYTLEIAQP